MTDPRATSDAVVDDPSTYAPGPWELLEGRTTGNFKFSGVFGLPTDDGYLEAIVEVRPRKSYEQPGFCDCHRVTVREYRARDPPSTTTIAESPSQTEYLDETLGLANVAMVDLLEADEVDEAPDPVAIDDLVAGDRVLVNWFTEPLRIVDAGRKHVDVDDGVEYHPVATGRGWGQSDNDPRVELVDGDDGPTYSTGPAAPPRRIEYLTRAD